MKNVLFCMLALGLLAGCQSVPPGPLLIQKELVVAIPPDKLFNCPLLVKPNPDTLTDVDLGIYINDLDKRNKMCHNNIGAIKLYLENAKKNVNTPPPNLK